METWPTWYFFGPPTLSPDNQRLADALLDMKVPYVVGAGVGTTMITGPHVIRGATLMQSEHPELVGSFNMLSTIAHWGQWSLNADCCFIPVGHFGKHWRELSKPFQNKRGGFFLKPDDCNKDFAGQVMTHKAMRLVFAELIGTHMAAYHPESLVMISRPKKIINEYRFVIAGGRVVSASPYRVNGKVTYLATDIPKIVRRFAEARAADRKWQPGWWYSMDVCYDGISKPKIVELNPFSISRLYNCPMQPLIVGMSQAAVAYHDAPKAAQFCNSTRSYLQAMKIAGLIT